MKTVLDELMSDPPPIEELQRRLLQDYQERNTALEKQVKHLTYYKEAWDGCKDSAKLKRRLDIAAQILAASISGKESPFSNHEITIDASIEMTDLLLKKIGYP